MGLFNTIRMGASGGGDYEVERSLRFNNDDSPRINRTPSSAGNRKTWTKSFWLKRGSISRQFITAYYISGTDVAAIEFTDTHVLSFYDYYNGYRLHLVTNRVFRDPSAWYHIVIALDTTQSTSSDRAKIYVNNEQVTSFSTETYPSQNLDVSFNQNVLEAWGTEGTNQRLHFDGYMSEITYIDGLQLTPSSFGETDAITGQWKPKKYVGSYGTNGFYLNFLDNSGTTATTLGKDSSGNGNNFTPNNFVTGDAVKDSPTNNFSTLMLKGTPAASGCSLKQGNLEFETGTTGSGGNGNRLPFNTISPTSGKWYVEVMPTTTNLIFIGVHPYQVEIVPTSDATRWQGLYSYNGESYLASTGSTASNSTYAASYGNNDVIGIYMDMDASPPQVYFAKNGQWANGSGSWNQSTPTGAITLGGTFFTTSTGGFEGIGINIRSASSPSNTSAQANFGQDSTFSGRISAGGNTDANGIGDFKYPVPANALALCSANLPDPTILLPNQHFDTVLWTGNTSASRDITGVGFDPSIVSIKARTNTYEFLWFDAVRGAGKRLFSHNSNAESDNLATLNAFITDGFRLGNGSSVDLSVNGSASSTYVAWNWNSGSSTVTNNDGSISSQVRANTTAGISIVSYEGTGSLATVGHGLGVKPDAMIFKNRDQGHGWLVYHSSLGATKNLGLNTTSAAATASNKFNDTEPTSTVFTVNTAADSNQSGQSIIAYCFSEVAGYSKFGSYTGNGNADGTFVFTGFRPAWVMLKRYDTTGDWNIYDNERNGFNSQNYLLRANETTTEAAVSGLDLLSNGFKLRVTGGEKNGNGNTFVYLAFAESPFKNSRAR